MAKDCDVLVIGAGLAGAGAAEQLSAAGLSVWLLEARERIGGRAYFRSFRESNLSLEFGGAWITPWQSLIREACERHGVKLRARTPVKARRWWRDGALRHDGPASTADAAAHRRAIETIRADAMRLKSEPEFAAISFGDYLRALAQGPVRMPQSTCDLCLAWWSVSGNGDIEKVAASEFLSSCAYGDGDPDGIIGPWADTLEGGVAGLARRMIEGAGASLVLGACVASIAHGPGNVLAKTSDGRSFRARAAILATGLNMLQRIDFDPGLPPAKEDGRIRGHLGRAVKVWIKAKGLAVGTLATGEAGGLNWMFVERDVDGAQYVVGFGLQRPDFDPASTDAVRAVFKRFFPEGDFITSDWHDWVADPFAHGTWVAPPLGHEQSVEAGNWRALPPLAFASSDIASQGAGWFEAALLSGRDAAVEIAAALRT